MGPKGCKVIFLIMIGGWLLITLTSSLWSQQAYPTKPINLLIAYSPGGVVDISERFLASKTEKILGQSIIVSNNGGGGILVAFEITARKPPDGYNTVGGANTGLVRIPLFREVPYQRDDFIPIMHFATPLLTPVVTKSTSPWMKAT
jgi:tripartite-type tricarboxylate transporter receptor subunit TctC